ncbi:unnamed protein product, partial [Rotaria socialis]
LNSVGCDDELLPVEPDGLIVLPFVSVDISSSSSHGP